MSRIFSAAGVCALLLAGCSGSLGGDDSESTLSRQTTQAAVSTPAATPEPTSEPAPTAQADPQPTSTPVPEATAVPTSTATPVATPAPEPTPAWEFVEGGPRVSPFTYILEATVAHPQFLPGADGWSIAIARNPDLPIEPADLTRPVLDGQPGDQFVSLPMPRYREIAQAYTSDFVWRTSNRLMEVDISRNRLRIFEGNELLFEQSVSTGTRSNPVLPAQSYFESFELFSDRPGGLMRLGVIPNRRSIAWEQGIEAVTLASVEDAELGRWNTDAFVMVDPATFERIVELLPKGSKVDIFGAQPSAQGPASTPVPAVAAACPADTLGVAPDCYRVVPGNPERGPCTGSAVGIDDSCWFLYGDPEPQLDPEITRCPGHTQLREERCYVLAGPRPELDPGCPDWAPAVGTECRQPVAAENP